MFGVAVFAVGAGAFGPIYLHSADQTILNGVLRDAPVGNSGLTFEAKSGNGSPTRLLTAAASVPQHRRWFGNPISTDLAGLTSVVVRQPFTASLVSRSEVCAHLDIVAGHCAEQNGTVVMSTRSAEELGLELGQALVTSPTRSHRVLSLTIVGLYRAGNPDAPYWWGVNLFAFGEGSPARPELDAIFASPQTVRATAPPSLISYMVQVPYRQGSLAVNDVAAFESSITTYQSDLLSTDGIVVSTQLLQVLSQATAIDHTTTTIVAVIDLQLVLLAVYVLYFVAARTAAEREPDVRLAAIRGFRQRSTIAVAMMEPTAIVVAAVPVGLLVAWVVMLVGASSLFGSGVGASVTLLAIGAAVVTGLFGVGATFLGTRRMLAAVEATSASDGSSTAQRFSTWTVVADVAAVAIAGAAFVELAAAGVSGTTSTSHTDPLAAFAPGLLALAVGILGARLLPPLLRSTFRYTSHSHKLALGLATRRVARRREFAPQVMLLSVAVGLTVFGISGWAIAAHNRAVQNEFDVGAAKVFTVAVRPGVDFLSAVRQADPSGRAAMAAVVENASNGTTLAVDSSRMSDVMSWPPGLGAGGAGQVAGRLVPTHLAPAVMVSGTAVRVSVDADVAAQPPPQLSLDLFDEGYQAPQQVTFGRLAPGHTTYQGSLLGVCPAGCRLVDLALTWAPTITSVTPTGSADVVVTSLSVRSPTGAWQPLGAGLTDVRRWSNPSGGARLSSGTQGLRAVVDLAPDGSPVTIAPADVPSELPAVVTPTSAIGSESGLLLAGLDGSTVRGRAIGQVPALPRLGDDATLVDLEMAQRLMTGPFVNDTTEVWVSGTAPASVLPRLAAQGISVVSVDTAGGREKASIHGGVELAYTLFFLSAIAAAVLAVGATAFAVTAGARQRQGELAALRAVGIPAASLRRSLEAEMGLTLGAGMLLGTVAGIVAAVFALKSVPEFVALGPGPPIGLGLPVLLLVVTLGALILALGVVVWIGATVFVREASADRLGGAQT
jgi:putative ABC transport system permease protein